MNKDVLQAAITGIFFGLWPLIANQTQLKGKASALFYNCVGILVLLPLAWKEINTIGNARWGLGIVAGLVAVCGVILFNDLLSKTSPERISLLIVVSLITNAMLQGSNHIRTNGITLDKGLGFLFAAIAIKLLLRK